MKNVLQKLSLYGLVALFCSLAPFTFSQAIAQAVTGTVSDENNEPLPGVNVILKNTSTGTVTDVEGNYSINASGDDDILIFSFIGYISQEIAVNGRSALDVVLSEDVQSLDEIVVIGYGTQKKSDLTGSVESISMEEKQNQANVNLMQALSGTVAGVNVENRGGASNEPSFSIRGQTSLSASNTPLIVLDGIIYNGSLADININDVESIDILKDASAAAVYGSRSANGVVIVTTKRGKSEKPVISLNAYYGVQDMTNNPMQVMNGDEFATRLVDWSHQNLLYQWYQTNPASEDGRPARPDVTDRNVVANYLVTQEEKDNYLAGNQIDWVDEVLQIAPMQNYDLSVSGKSSNNLSYFLSGSYTDVEGIQKNDEFKRLTVRSNLESEITDWLTLSLNASYSYTDQSGIPASLADARVASPLANNYIGEPSYDIYLGGELYQPYPLVYTYIDNSDTRNQLNLIGTVKIDIPWIEGLTNELNYSNRFVNDDVYSFHNSNTPQGVSNNGLATKDHFKGRDWILNNILSYSRSFGDHQVNATFLFSREGRTGESSFLSANGFSNQTLGYNNMGQGENSTVSTEAWEENSLAYMGRINYSYKSRYMITGTVRRDGYSGFSANNKWANFPSVSLAWVFSEEPFFEDLGDIYAKLRVSYGMNGNQGIGRYSSLSRMGTRYYVYGQTTAIGLYPSTLGNADLSWETTESYNFGLDYGFLNNRITGSVDFYTGETHDVLVQRQLPRAAGYSSVWANIGGLSNKGVDLTINSINLDQELRWETGFVFSLTRNKITKLYGDDDDADIGNQWFVGEPMSAIYDYEMAGGVWTEEEFFAGDIPLNGWYPGQFRYVDQNADSLISPDADRTIVGYAAPSFRFSITNTLTYKNFSLNFIINSIQGGNNFYMADNAVNISPLFDFSNRKNNSAINAYWRPDAPTTNTTGIYNNPPQRSGIYQSRSFVRLQDVTLSYRFGRSFLDNIGLSDLQVYLSSKNPYVWTDWQGWDPETGISDTPLMRNIIAGIRVSL